MEHDKRFVQKQETRELNPFESTIVAQEWINSVENERGLYRDTEVYPRLNRWIQEQPTFGTIVDIGSGQGICSDKLGSFRGSYIGVEPAKILVDRAKELYAADHREFLVGNAYQLPVASETADASFSIMVWFHLEDLTRASSELARILKPGGRFFIVTANPKAATTWESFYFEHTKEGKKITGKVKVPINPMSQSVFYQHSQEEILLALQQQGLTIDKTDEYGPVNDEPIFFSIEGKKEPIPMDSPKISVQ